ncbi:hypothetical protein [Wocania ichthyoenteri]|uniref:hypothetical protein n=1 Tax=Wocania ichthyoenteri TaxID=1230531 RepID=UPI00053D5FF4|nr:hypothetical protein [Wocania ichthyoenteri]
MKIKTLSLILILIVTLSCKNATKAEEISVADNLELNLNNGEKWIANLETHKGIKIMDSIISDFKKREQKDYTNLGEILSEQTSYIIKNCSMKGEPHNQLHVVLIPMLDKISTIKESNNNTKSSKTLIELETLIKTYFNYFNYFKL